MTPEEYFRKWSENCRIFIDYKPVHDHADMMQFAKDYHAEQLRIGNVSQRSELLLDYTKQLKKQGTLTSGQDESKLVKKYLSNNCG